MTRRHPPTEHPTSTIVDVGAAPDRAGDTEPPPPIEPKAAKPPNAMRDALAAQGKLDRINKREADAWANARVRYQAERDAVYVGLSDAVKRILEAAAAEEVEA